MKYKNLLAIAFICNILIIWWKIVILKNSETKNDKIRSILFFDFAIFIFTCLFTFILSPKDCVNNEEYNECNIDCKRIFYFNICGYIFFNFIKEIIIVLGIFLLLCFIYVILCAFMFLFFNINLTEKIIILTKKIKIIYENHHKNE